MVSCKAHNLTYVSSNLTPTNFFIISLLQRGLIIPYSYARSLRNFPEIYVRMEKLVVRKWEYILIRYIHSGK